MESAATALKLSERAAPELSDEELVAFAKSGDTEATRRILVRYQQFVRLKANSYFLAGGDGDDLIQEGYIGLYKAIRDYEYGRSTSFRSFAELCVTRQIITAIKTASRQKHVPLNTYLSFSHSPSSTDYESRTLADIIPSGRSSDPVQQVISSEECRQPDRLPAAAAEPAGVAGAEVLPGRQLVRGHRRATSATTPRPSTTLCSASSAR